MSSKNEFNIDADFLRSKVFINELKKGEEEAKATITEFYSFDLQILHTPFGPADGSRIWPHQKNIFK
jgi:hypothetical protein